MRPEASTADFFPEPSCDDDLRLRWRRLVDVTLPEAAKRRTWPVRYNHCFARILLDCAVGAPWRTAIEPPAWRRAPTPLLARAIALGEDCLSGAADLHELNRQSLAFRRTAETSLREA
ncbi:MAG: GCN5-related N-acetyltransferase [Pseudomonadota bacterium]